MTETPRKQELDEVKEKVRGARDAALSDTAGAREKADLKLLEAEAAGQEAARGRRGKGPHHEQGAWRRGQARQGAEGQLPRQRSGLLRPGCPDQAGGPGAQYRADESS